ncbi:chromate efflux transporter [Ancylothrix sp. C2]|uniref:chromate efflux transporter n=1 Tax=Ancylothrix sp. D3o TaxID=2953691 RepID=UPI0021BB1D5E|nr:chromate efflux transporter [Ancylothrix sp. D3o]MCT7952356.1 chromate efflux transporter [Ancylothrix sp. D3o]
MTSSTILHRLKELAKVFFKLGIIGFGGPAAHIAMMQEEIVTRRNWLTQQKFLDLLGATNLIPGPNSTEMAIHVGYTYAGPLGLIIAGISFITPAIAITGIFAWFYTQYGQLPQVAPALYGIKPAVLAIILAAVWKLGKTAVKNRKLLLVAVAVAVTVLAGVNEVLALLLGGVLGMLWLMGNGAGGKTLKAFIPWPVLSLFSFPNLPPIASNFSAFVVTLAKISPLGEKISLSAGASPSLWQLGLVFLKVGSVLFGGGYVLVAFLEGELVAKGWLTQQQLLDAIAIGQFTPGPVLSTATFIGYMISGWAGAVVATVGIFLPSFVFVALSNPLIERLRSSKWMSAFLDAVNVASVALMAVVVLKLGLAVVTDYGALLIAVAAAIAVIRFKVNAALIVMAGALFGLIFNLDKLL